KIRWHPRPPARPPRWGPRSADAASLLHPNAAAASGTPGLAALLIAQIFPMIPDILALRALPSPCATSITGPSVLNVFLTRDTNGPPPRLVRALPAVVPRARNPLHRRRHRRVSIAADRSVSRRHRRADDGDHARP